MTWRRRERDVSLLELTMRIYLMWPQFFLEIDFFSYDPKNTSD